MEINELLKKGVDLLGKREFSNPTLESILLLSRLLGEDKTYIYTYGEEEVDRQIEEEFLEAVEKRSKGYPLQYILKEKDFMGLDFYIEEGVLVPRSDTEVLVEYIIDYLEKKNIEKEINILDIGIGSGAISLSLAHYIKDARVYGIDIDDKALRVANKNKIKLGISNANFYKGDIFGSIEDLKTRTYSIVASNPPYIAREEIEKLQKEVREYEPLLALDGGEDGLDFYRRITDISREILKEDGLLIYEIGYDQGQAVSHILKKAGYRNIEILKDLNGLDRVVLANI